MRPEANPEQVAIANRVLALREAIELSQREMARRGGLEREHLSMIENGANRASSARVRRALATAASVPVDALDEYIEGRLSLRDLLLKRQVEPKTGTEG